MIRPVTPPPTLPFFVSSALRRRVATRLRIGEVLLRLGRRNPEVPRVGTTALRMAIAVVRLALVALPAWTAAFVPSVKGAQLRAVDHVADVVGQVLLWQPVLQRVRQQLLLPRLVGQVARHGRH